MYSSLRMSCCSNVLIYCAQSVRSLFELTFATMVHLNGVRACSHLSQQRSSPPSVVPAQFPSYTVADTCVGGLAPIGTLLSHQLWGDARLSPQSLFLMNQTVKERSDPSFFAREV
jgi:hypothetical protein